ncbi:MAG: sigma-70 family RNA polymerase sigma factor [Saprospiraceae bacterium]|jgi:RNA polymerase sigma-70 factor (ECF subfamily)|nr:sigma-70 family RNA polymerase sigma factor [Saprospiraceae bacterium]MBK6480470.1 sigma-70 family RNA polymerase sigma factor [Saprospiraceae bacterium]MBK6817159.1 sigma-70 family RNA polymerase sigma factor [Saprospiraceae bacterium]MBK7435814.1 sigma-70 family RNA polymerase sigma factor [Saprospiraceae bacterium]MBK7606464.1 sigma-70 family RNA polymerase sigma factor [Saprospiraceae bacterium]
MRLILQFLEVLFSKFRSKGDPTLADEVLVAQYIDTQDDQLFSILYNRYSAKIYGKCITMLKNMEAAQDCTQEIFIKVLTNISRFNQQSRFSTWLFSITYNHCIDLIRKNRKNFFVDVKMEHADKQDEVSDIFLMETKVSRLKKVLGDMDDDDKTILLMKYQDDLSIKEMGDILGKGESAIKMKIQRAKHKFKSIHDELFKNEED